jgi:hypothetical protein
MNQQPEDAPPELSLAGSVVDKAIEYMTGQNVPPIAIASAFLGGAVSLLARTMPDESIVRVLENAIASVKSGAIHN